MRKYNIIFIISLFVLTNLGYSQCPQLAGFVSSTSLPKPCEEYSFFSRLYNVSNQAYTVSVNYGDASPIQYFNVNALPYDYYQFLKHTYPVSGTYVPTLTAIGPGTCITQKTTTVNVNNYCSSCSVYSVLSTGYDRVNNMPFTSNSGNFDPYWYVVRKQYLSAAPNYTPLPNPIFNYTNLLAYDIDPLAGYYFSLTTGDARYISLNSTAFSTDLIINLVTYRTYFKLPSTLPSNKSYSLMISARADDAIYQVKLNGTDIKSPGYVNDGGSYGGNPLVLTVNSCSTNILKGDSNYIDISVADVGLGATQLSAEIILLECSTSCFAPCKDCIGSFAPIPGKKYVVSAWAKEQGAPQSTTTYTNAELSVISGTTTSFYGSGQIIDGWQRIEGEFTIPSSSTTLDIKLNCQSGNCYFDDIRVFPFDGSMKSYVYDPITMRLVAELDERNYATLYEYDEEGKLIRVKKETEKGKMTIQENRNNTKK